mgnify:FL=1
MATLDNINIFANGGPAENTLEDEYQSLVAVFNSPGVMGSPPSFEEFVAMRQKSQAADTARQTMTQELGAGNVKKAYEEGFTQLPISEQLGAYINPVTGIPIETYETGYFADEAGLGLKKPQEFLLDMLNPSKNILQKLPVKAEDPVSAALAPLSALGAIGGVFDLANLPKAGLMAFRNLNQKTMDGGGGGIGDLPEPIIEPSLDLAGYKSNVLEEAKSISGELSPKALLQYLKSNKRTNPANNKKGTALKQTEIDEIDFAAFEAQYPNKDYTNEDILQYIDDNRVQLYRVSRSEDDPTYTGIEDDNYGQADFYLDEPLTQEIRSERINDAYNDFERYNDDQKLFFAKHFGPEGTINKETYDAFVERQRQFIQREDANTSGQAPSQLIGEYITGEDTYENPFRQRYQTGSRQYDIFDRDGNEISNKFPAVLDSEKLEEILDLGHELKPRNMQESFDMDSVLNDAAELSVNDLYDGGMGEEVYRFVGEEDLYEIIGSEDSGYSVYKNNRVLDSIEELSFDEARIQVNQDLQRSIELREGAEGYTGFAGEIRDSFNSDENLIDVLPTDVIEGNATIPTKYGEEYDSYRLPMGGASDYQEHTLHIKNPKTVTRYSGSKGPKHFGGGDEVFHLRTSIRTDENGKKVLFVEEIQSDLHSTAKSPKYAGNYEVPPKELEKIKNKVNNISPRMSFNENTGAVDFDKNMPSFAGISGGTAPAQQSARNVIASGDVLRDNKFNYYEAGNEANFSPLETTTKFLEDEYGKETILELADALEPFRNAGNLPNLPYKGNDWIDAAVKEAIKIGAEKGADRVSFTNFAEQMQRNNKRLNYVQDTIIKRVPTREEILASPKFAEDLARDKKMYYDDYVNNTHNTNLPIPTMEEYFARPSIPNNPIIEEYLAVTPSGDVQTNLDTVKEITYKSLAREEGVGQYRYKVDDVGYALKGDEILNPQRIQMEGDDYLEQRFNPRLLQSDEELLAEIPEKYKKQVMEDLDSGKQEITLNIDDIDGSGKKFMEIYKGGVTRGINKALKDLKIKDAKHDTSNILYADDPGYDPEQLFTDFRRLLQQSDSDDKDTIIELAIDRGFEGIKLHKSIGIDLTDEMKKKILEEGLPSMYMGGKVTKSDSMDRPIVGNRREM